MNYSIVIARDSDCELSQRVWVHLYDRLLQLLLGWRLGRKWYNLT
jgi:hypothetical protein